MPKEDLEKRVKLLEHEIERLRAINEIQLLVGQYAVLHTPQTFKTVPDKIFAMKQPDVSVEIALWGVYVGAEQLRILYGKLHEEPLVGTMFEHQFSTPMIQVAGDGKTAKGVWFSVGHETPVRDGKPKAFWCWGKYGADFIKEDGKWKIWHWHFYGTFMCPYEKSWVDTELPRNVKMSDFDPRFAKYPPSKPTTYAGSGYFKDTIREPIPACPEPYETWDGKSAA